MASLTGNLVAETYKALLKTIDNDILTASEKQITDGLGGGSNVFIDSNGFLRANKYKVTNGLATQFLKADGSLDANTYLTSITGAQVITALGYTPVTDQRTLTINGVTYNLTANRSWTVAGTAAIWGNITGTLSNQTDLQAALNAKFNVPAGTISQYIRGDGSLATFPTLPGGLPTGGTAGQILAKINSTDYNTEWIDNFATQTKNEVKLGQTLSKGAAVYVSSADGTNIVVSAASNTSEALSSKTFGLLETGGSTNAFVKCVTFGLLAGLNTTGATAGDPVWLGVNGALIYGLANKPYAPKHLVYIGVVTRVNANNGEIFVNVQNGFELKEIHDVYIADPANNHGLFYDISDGLWKNKSIAGALGYTPQAQLNGTGFVKASGTTISYDNSTYLTTANAAATYLALTGGTLTGSITATSFVKTGGTSTQYLKADGSVAEITGDIISGAGSAGYVPKWTSAIVLGSSLLYDNGTSMSIGTITLNYGGYGRTLTGSGFAATSFGFEAVTGSTTNGGLIGGLSLVIANNDSSRRIGSQIQSYISGATATNQGADLRFYVKPDAGVLLEIVRMTSAGITFNKDLTATNITATAFIKSGGTSSQFLMADGSVSTLSSPVTGSGSAGYIPKWTTAANIGSSIIYEDVSIGIAYTTPNRGGYGRTLSGASFGSASFGFEAVSNTTTNGGLIGGLSFIVNQNDSSRIVGSAIQSNLVGTTATNYGADLRFFAKADGVFTIAEVARMTSAGLRVYGTIVKDGGTSSQYLMADGSVTTLTGVVTGSGTGNYITKWATGSTISNSIIYDNGSSVGIGATTLARKLEVITGNGVTNGIRLTYANGSTTEGMDITYLNSGQTTTSFDSLYNSASAVMQFRMKTAATPVTAMTIFGSGNISTGSNTDAGYSFDINGTLRVQNNASFSGTGRFFNTLTFAGGDRKFECADSGGVSFYTNEINANAQGVTGSLYFGWRGTTALNFGVTSNFSTNINVNGQGRFYGVSAPIRTESTANNEMQIVRATTTNGAGFGFYTNAAHNWLLGTAWGETSSNFILYNAATGTQTMRVDYSNNDVTFSNKVVSNDQFRVLASGNYRINNNVNGLIGYLIRSGAWKGNAENNISLATDGPYGISFFTNGTGVEKFHVTSGGNIVINNGTTDAGYKLDVNGTGRFQGTLQSDNATTAELRLRGGGYGTNYNTSLRSVAGASGILQFGNNGENYVLIGNTAAGGYLDFRTNCNSESIASGSPAFRLYANASAYFWSSVTATSFFESSDIRLKKLIESNPIIAGIEKLEAKLYEKNGKIELGYFAQDAELIMPYAVSKNDEGFLNLSYREIHTAKIARLEKEVAELKEKLNVA